MLGNEMIGANEPKQRGEGGPIDDAVAGGDPAVVGRGAQWRRVLGLDDVDPIREPREFCGRVGAGPDDPAAIDLEAEIGATGSEDVVNRARAVAQGHELEVMVVPGDLEAVRLGEFRAAPKRLAVLPPVGRGRTTLLGGDVGGIIQVAPSVRAMSMKRLGSLTRPLSGM